jgi:hypothetical protein
VKHGKCKLCLEDKNLQASHFLPAGIFKSLLQPAVQSPHPYFMSPTQTRETSQQMKDFLLCADCEQRFGKNGERWVLSQMSRDSGFPLQEKLLKTTPIRSIAGLTTYAGGSIPEIDVDKLEYFALSVFWRAAVHSWIPVLGDAYERLELGPYRESLRQFLVGSGPFPANVVTMISVYEQTNFTRTTFPPEAGERNPNEGQPYSFLIPGIQFSMTLGKQLTSDSREFSSHLQPERRIFMTPLIGQQVDQLRAKLLAKQRNHHKTPKAPSRGKS